MPTVINFNAAGARFKADPAPSTTVTYDTTSSNLSVVNGGLDIERVITYAQTVSSRATVTTTENGTTCPFAATQDARLNIDRVTGRVIPTIAMSTDDPVSADVVMQAPKAGRIIVPVGVRALAVETGSTYNVRPGTLVAHVNSAIAALVQGRAAGDDAQTLYQSNSYLLDAPAVARNPNFFCGSLDWSGMSAISFADGQTEIGGSAAPAHLIGPRHAIIAWHYPGVNQRYAFVGVDGSYYVRRRTSLTRIASTDVGLVTFGEDIPVTGASRVTPFRLLPQNFRDRFCPGNYLDTNGNKIPNYSMVHSLRRKRWANTNSWGGSKEDTMCVSPLRLTGSSWAPIDQITPVNVSTRQPNLYPTFYGDEWTGGDSGSGVFIPVNGSPVLVTTADGVGLGPAISIWLPQLIAAMESTVPGSTAQWPRIVDLSGFVRL
jgi:hypothetical protein